MSNINFRVFQNPDRVNEETIMELAQYPVPNIADMMNRFGCLDSGLNLMNSASNIKFYGNAITVKTRATDNLMVHKALDMAEKGDVIVVDARGEMGTAIIGEIMCKIAIKKGIKGFIIDGLIRDKEFIEELDDFFVYARGYSPHGPYKDGPGEVNGTISCGGTIVNSGDVVIGDDNGVVIVRPEDIDDLINKTKEKNKQEEKTFKEIEEGTLDRSWIDKTLKENGCEFV